jgi:phosphoribosylglycinamide formyltransferase-1
LSAAPVNLLVDVHDERFDRTATHHLLEALGSYAGITPSRYVRAPDVVYAWLDATFGGWWSSDVAAGSAWVATDAAGFLGVAGYDARRLRYRWQTGKEPGTAIFGPFGFMQRAHPELQTALLRGAMFAIRERGYRKALIGAVSDPHQVEFYRREAGAEIAGSVEPDTRRFRAVVLASGSGSNFRAVAEAAQAGSIPLDIAAAIVNKPGAGAIAHAEALGIPVHLVPWDRKTEPREVYDRRVIETLAREAPQLVLLLGWMHVLPPAFVDAFPETLNLHPAYLPLDPQLDAVTYPDGSEGPAFRGARPVDDALAAGSRWIGASVHRAGLEVDRGAILVRAPLAVEFADRAALMERLHALERRVVAGSIARWAAELS